MVDRIERIIEGEVKNSAARFPHEGGEFYLCYERGQTMNPVPFATLDEVANYLTANERSRVRMQPNGVLIVRNIHIDGVAREELPPPG